MHPKPYKVNRIPAQAQGVDRFLPAYHPPRKKNNIFSTSSSLKYSIAAMKTFAVAAVLALAASVAARDCTEGLEYCGHTLLDIGT